jgi:hypothetical protein
MSQKPANQKLWEMVIAQARAKYAKYPSPAASHWVHQQYVKYGGKFIVSDGETQEKKRFVRAWHDKMEQMHNKHSDEKR